MFEMQVPNALSDSVLPFSVACIWIVQSTLSVCLSTKCPYYSNRLHLLCLIKSRCSSHLILQ